MPFPSLDQGEPPDPPSSEVSNRSLVARPIVLTHIADRRLIHRLVQAVPGLGEIAPVPSIAELVDLARSTPGVAAIVLSIRGAHGESALPHIVELHSALPYIPIVLVLRAGDEARESIPAAVRAGVTHVVHSALETPDSLRALFASILSFPVPREVLEVIADRIPRAARDVVSWCVQNGYRPITVPEVAQELGLNRKTVFRRLERSGLPSSTRIIAWSRLVHVATRLDRAVTPIGRIARDMLFGTEASLRTFVKRETGLTASQMRERGAVLVAIETAIALIDRPA